jgi:hypothetical protein
MILDSLAASLVKGELKSKSTITQGCTFLVLATRLTHSVEVWVTGAFDLHMFSGMSSVGCCVFILRFMHILAGYNNYYFSMNRVIRSRLTMKHWGQQVLKILLHMSTTSSFIFSMPIAEEQK